ncbi:MAG: asparagine synthase (glutamine-hydrolyzing) [Acidobacteriota bacterium]|nr:asparagine synthase (glutamine-hydrolyzing) [Acidobacteriota bacterium]
MCGIVGFVSKRKNDLAAERIGRMLNVLEHRGPDDKGVESWERAVLGHRRLSIFDLSSAGHQPMLSPDGKIGVVFNGAIYNFRALRGELKSAGYTFESQTDTEVLIHGYNEWGIDKLVQNLRGMFAFGLWDDRRGRLFLVRDRLGVKPLVYAIENGAVAFASSVRALKFSGFGGDLDEQAVAEYLEFGFVTDDFSIYQNIKKIPAATILEWSEGEIKTRKYWDLPQSGTIDISFEQAVEETEKLFLQAVEKRLDADVPVGALLSGGIDSGLVCWAIKHLGGDITAYTVGTPNDVWDESLAAAETAKTLGIRHKILEMNADAPPNVSDLIKAYGEPFACASALGMLDVSKVVAKEATVLLTGDGGDDIFLGYPEHKNFWLAQRAARQTPDFAKNLWLNLRGNVPQSSALKRASSFLDYVSGGLAAVGTARDGLPVYRKNNLLGERLNNIKISHREMIWSKESGKNLLSEFLEYDRRTRFTGEYLTKVDGGTMFYALEARSPFLDSDLWEFAASLPFSIRMNGGNSKAVLREIARRRISEKVAAGRKQGFGVPVQRWITGHWRGAIEEVLRDSLLEQEGWINSAATLELLKKSAEKNWAPRQLWFIYVLESWLRYERENTGAKILLDKETSKAIA